MSSKCFIWIVHVLIYLFRAFKQFLDFSGNGFRIKNEFWKKKKEPTYRIGPSPRLDPTRAAAAKPGRAAEKARNPPALLTSISGRFRRFPLRVSTASGSSRSPRSIPGLLRPPRRPCRRRRRWTGAAVHGRFYSVREEEDEAVLRVTPCKIL
jgi:hypothetical protein